MDSERTCHTWDWAAQAVWMLAMGTSRQGQLCSQRRVWAWTTSQVFLAADTEGR